MRCRLAWTTTSRTCCRWRGWIWADGPTLTTWRKRTISSSKAASHWANSSARESFKVMPLSAFRPPFSVYLIVSNCKVLTGPPGPPGPKGDIGRNAKVTKLWLLLPWTWLTLCSKIVKQTCPKEIGSGSSCTRILHFGCYCIVQSLVFQSFCLASWADLQSSFGTEKLERFDPLLQEPRHGSGVAGESGRMVPGGRNAAQEEEQVNDWNQLPDGFHHPPFGILWNAFLDGWNIRWSGRTMGLVVQRRATQLHQLATRPTG